MVKRYLGQSWIAALLLLSILIVTFGCGGGEIQPPTTVNLSKESPETRGEEVVAEYLKRDAAPYRKQRVRFTIKTADEPDKIYELETYRKQTPDGTTTLTQIVKPPDESDLASLTVEPMGQNATIITYAASRGEFRETDTNKMFFGGLTAGELLGEWQKFQYRLVGDKEVNGQQVFEVEGKLTEGAYSVVARMQALFRKETYVPAELHFFDNQDREIRSYKVVELKDDPVHPYAARIEVENPIYKSHVTIEILEQEFPASIDEAMFSREKLRATAKKQ
jgi:Outer membrane lipoprotein-sorting protein